MRAVIADDHPLCREAVRAAIRTFAPDCEFVMAHDYAETQAALSDGDVDLLVFDLAMPNGRGLDVLKACAQARAGLPIVVVSGHDSADVIDEVSRAGAHGFVSKAAPISEMIAALKDAITGAPSTLTAPREEGALTRIRVALASLTPAQTKVLQAMRAGRLNKQIAYDLGLSEITVKSHVKEVLRKLGVTSRHEAAALANWADDVLAYREQERLTP